MLHELLLTLSGHPGDVFAPSFNTTARGGEGFSIPPDFPFLHSAERYALERLSVLGYYYQNFTTFINSGRKAASANRSIRSNTTGPYGSYFRAFCATLDKELEEYRELIIDCEIKILSKLDLESDGGRTPISYLEHKFAKFHLIFPHINDVISVIEANPGAVHGMRLLNLLHERNATGLPHLREMFTRLLLGTSQVFIKQLVAWVVYGQLSDPHGEFFIKMDGTTGKVEHLDKRGTAHQEHTRWHSEYVLDPTYAPKFIGSNIGDEVLFIGKAVNVVNQLHDRNDFLKSNADIQQRLQDVTLLLEPFVLRPLEFANSIVGIKQQAAATLWDTVVLEQHLYSHLKGFRNLHLLGYGSCWVQFIEECESLRLKSAARLSPITEHDLNRSFKSIMKKSGMTDFDATADKIRFEVLRRETNQAPLANPFADNLIGVPLRLSYQVEWPLNLIFTQSDIDKYNTIMSFLLVLKRTHMRVQRIWSMTQHKMHGDRVATRRSRCAVPTAGSDAVAQMPRELWYLRTLMMFFLDCLWSYIQMDVLDSNYHQMMEQIFGLADDDESDTTGLSLEGRQEYGSVATHPDLEDIRAMHSEHLAAILRGCFLDSSMARLVGSTVQQVLSLCDRFCGMVDRAMGWSDELPDGGRRSSNSWKNILSLRMEFERHTSFLFRTFAEVKGTSHQAQCLAQLLLRMDHNRWFSAGSSLHTHQILEKDRTSDNDE